MKQLNMKKVKLLVAVFFVLFFMASAVNHFIVNADNKEETNNTEENFKNDETEEFVPVYTNAEEFWEKQLSSPTGCPLEMKDGAFYYVTVKRTDCEYDILGFDMVISDYRSRNSRDKVTVPISLREGGSMKCISSVTKKSETGVEYQYNLYCIPIEDIFELANLIDSTTAKKLLEGENTEISLYGIMTTKDGTTLSGAITEDGKGGITETGNVYHLYQTSNYMTLKHRFKDTGFEAYCNLSVSVSSWKNN